MRVCGGGEKDCAGAWAAARGINWWRWEKCACVRNKCAAGKQVPFGGNEKAPRGAGPFTVLQVCASYFLAVFLAGAGLAASCAFWAASSSDSCLPS